MTTSEELLSAYRECGSEEAFRELVERYVDLVYSTALRKLAGNPHLAEDVVQTVFSDLATKARVGLPIKMLGGWLHQHACFTAAKMVRGELRRRTREKEAVQMNTPGSSSESPWNEVAPLLDDALEDLDPSDRQAIVMRFFERRDYRSVGEGLGISVEAAQKRVARAVDRLQVLLKQRGVSMTSMALAALLSEQCIQAAPPGMAMGVAMTALKTATSVTGLTLLLMRIAVSTKLKLALGSAVILGLAMLTPTVLNSAKHDSGKPVGQISQSNLAVMAPQVTNLVPGLAAQQIALPGAQTIQGPMLQLTVLDAETSQPVGRAAILYPGREADTLYTDRAGHCDVPYSPQIEELNFLVSKEQFATTRLIWKPKEGERIPAAYSLRMARAGKIGGSVVDADDVPVQGALVGFMPDDLENYSSRPESHAFYWERAQSDSLGRWEINTIAPELLRRISGSVTHPDYLGSDSVSLRDNPVAFDQLQQGTLVFHLKRGVIVRGRVVNPEGEPVAGASVLAGKLGYAEARRTTTDTTGNFELKACPPGTNLLTAEAEGYVATTIGAEFSNASKPFKLTLERAATNPLRLRVVDRSDKPIAQAHVMLDTLGEVEGGDQPLLQTGFDDRTDEQGRIVWTNAPNRELQFTIVAAGYMRTGGVKARPDGKEYKAVMAPGLVLEGTVVDAESHRPIPRFRLNLGWANQYLNQESPSLSWNEIDRFKIWFSDGKFRHSLDEDVCGGHPECVVRIDAPGYSPFISRIIKLDEENVRLDVTLNSAMEKNVKVLLPDGSPAAGADVGLVGDDVPFTILPGSIQRNSRYANSILTTDSSGTVRVRLDDAVKSVVAVHPAGYVEVSKEALLSSSALALQKWGRIEGTYAPKMPPQNSEPVRFGIQAADGLISVDSKAFSGQVDASGKFVIEQVPAGRYELVGVMIRENSWGCRYLGKIINTSAGRTVTVSLPGDYTVIAHLVVPPEAQPLTEAFHVFLNNGYPVAPAEVVGNKDAYEKWRYSPETMRLFRKARAYALRPTSDGKWVAEGVPAGGTYYLKATLTVSSRPMTVFSSPVVVTVPGEPSTGEIDLGPVELERMAPYSW